MKMWQIGEYLVFEERVHVVRGVSPASVTPVLVHLTDIETGEQREVLREDLERDEREDAAA